MNIDNVFDLIIYVVFAIIPQLGGLVPKYQDLVIDFSLVEGKTIPQFHIRDIQEGT